MQWESNNMKNPKTTTIEEIDYIRKDIVFKGALIIAALVSPLAGYIIADVIRVSALALY
jgi:hypothetical protein